MRLQPSGEGHPAAGQDHRHRRGDRLDRPHRRTAFWKRRSAISPALTQLDGMQDTYLAVNFSPLQFEPDLPRTLAALLSSATISALRASSSRSPKPC